MELVLGENKEVTSPMVHVRIGIGSVIFRFEIWREKIETLAVDVIDDCGSEQDSADPTSQPWDRASRSGIVLHGANLRIAPH